MPRPPPPAVALMMTGYLSLCATLMASSSVEMSPSLPGVIGTPAFFMVSRAMALSPMARICSGPGPMKVMLQLLQTSAKWAFSERKPKPGCMASTSQISATLMMRSISR
jgi:hypothetical protein